MSALLSVVYSLISRPANQVHFQSVSELACSNNRQNENCKKENTNSVGVVLSTAHPAKFIDTVEECIGEKIDLPKDLSVLVDRKKSFKEMPIGFNDFKTFLKAF